MFKAHHGWKKNLEQIERERERERERKEPLLLYILLSLHRHYTRTNHNLSCLFKFYFPSNYLVFFLFEYILTHFLSCVGLQQQITLDNGDIIIIIIIDACAHTDYYVTLGTLYT